MGNHNHNQPENEVDKALAERDTQIKDLCGHMEKLALEKESLQQELKSLKIKVGEINEQLGMLMETIQAKDEVIIKLSQQSGDEETQSAECNSPSATREQQELDILKVVQEHPNIQYLTKVSTPLTFFKIFYYILSCDNTEEITLCYNVK